MEHLYRFELIFNGEPQNVGLFYGLIDTGISEKKADSLTNGFEELSRPELDAGDYVFWFTDYGCSKFLPAITAIRNTIRPRGWNLICKTIPDNAVTRSAAIYEDSQQVALINDEQIILPEITTHKFDLRKIKQLLENKPPKGANRKMSQKLVSFENDFYEGALELQHDNPDALAAVTIDGYPEDENKPGRVVCKIWITKHGDIIVDPHENDYMQHETVRHLIEETKETLRQAFENVNK